MTQDAATTPRKPLTPTQRLKLFEAERGMCCVCGLKIIGSFIDEHKRALGLAGGNELSNRGVAHPKCAAVKTHDEDMPRIVKAKAQKRAHLGIKSAPTRPLVSRGFPATDKSASRIPHTPTQGNPEIARRFNAVAQLETK